MTKATVLIAYPSAFLSRDKFMRKVMLYTRSIAIKVLILSNDPNGFIADLDESLGIEFVLNEQAHVLCTHAIIFDNRGLFTKLVEVLKERRVAGKKVDLKLAAVANKDRGEGFDIYIGRGTIWGNPYPIGPAGDREEVLRKYQYDFDRRLLRFFEDHDKNVNKIRGKILGCHCRPAACHGDILAAYVNSLDDGE